MAGYNGFSMSNNAVAAYNNGERPISRWTKKAVIEEIADALNCDIKDFELLKSFKDYLTNSSWHHSSKFYNKVEFYKVMEVEEILSEIEFLNEDLKNWQKNELERMNQQRFEYEKALLKKREEARLNKITEQKKQLEFLKKSNPKKDHYTFEENDKLYFGLPEIYKILGYETYIHTNFEGEKLCEKPYERFWTIGYFSKKQIQDNIKKLLIEIDNAKNLKIKDLELNLSYEGIQK